MVTTQAPYNADTLRLCAEWAAKATSAKGGLKPKLIGEPPKRPRQAAKIFSDEKLRLVKQSGSRPAWRANTIPQDVQDDYEGLAEDKKQGWEALAAGRHLFPCIITFCPVPLPCIVLAGLQTGAGCKNTMKTISGCMRSASHSQCLPRVQWSNIEWFVDSILESQLVVSI